MEHALKTIHIPGWALGALSIDKVTQPSMAYDRIPIVRRSVDIIADSVASVPYYIKRGEADAKWPYPQNLNNLLRNTTVAFLVQGAGYWLKNKNRIRTAGIQWLNPTTIEVKFVGRRPDGTIGLDFTQNAENKTQHFDETQIVYFRQFSISNDIAPGPSRVETILDAANLHFHMTRFAKQFFEGGAQPTLVATAEGNPSNDEIKRAETFFQRSMQGIKNAFRVLGLQGVWKFQNITPPIDELAMPELAAYALQQVAIGMGIPETMLSDAANYATAESHDAQFWKNTVVPLCRMLESVINEQLLEDSGLSLEFVEEELDIFQEDENKRATSLKSLADAGLPLVVAMQILGYELPKDMTYDQLEVLIEENKPEPPPMLPAPSNADNAVDVTPADANARTALRAWERFVTKRIKDGKPLREFVTEQIPGALKAAVDGALEAVASVDEARRVFGDALLWTSYP